MAAAAPAAAPAPAAGKRKRDLSEDDVYLILHKYTPATILTALQEVAQHAGRRRIDWRALVAKTATGITSAREYQMLWRYIAYRHDFVEIVDDGAQPLGDESDLECEIEAFPTPSSEAVAEATGFAKILIYGSSREQASTHRVNSEVPVPNTPNEKIPRVPSEKHIGQSHRLTNGTGLVSNSKQVSHAGLSPDPFDGNGPHKKKKKPKPWSKEEDADLTTGVHKCGEGNWLDIMHKYSFDSSRTAVQLSQRWALISKRQGTTKPANAKPVTSNFDMKATQKAFSMALGMPTRRLGLSSLRSGISQQSTQHHAPVFGTATPELKSATSSSSVPLPVPVPVSAPMPVPVQVQMPLHQVQQAPAQAPPLRVSNTSNKSRNNSKKQAAQANLTNAPSSIQAAAIAAGGRIATHSVATSLLKAAQSTKAVHIRSRGRGSSKTSTSSKSSTMAGESGTQLGSAQAPELPVCSAPTPSPPVLTTQSTEQLNVVPEVAGVSPSEQSASAHLFETEKTSSTTPVSGPCDSMEMDDDSTFCVVTMEDLFPEDVKQPDTVDPKAEEIIDPKAEEIIDPKPEEIKPEETIDPKDADMLEFDRFVAQGCLSIDKSKGVKIAPGSQGASVSQKKQPKQLPTAGKSIPIFSRAPASMKKTKTLGSPGVTSPPTVTSSGLVGTGNAGLLSKALGGQQTGLGTTAKPNRCQEIMAQKQHATNSRSNGMAKNLSPGTVTPARNAAPGAGTPARNTTSGSVTPARNTPPGSGAPVRNAAPGTGTLGKNTAPGTGTPAKNAAPGTGTLAKNTAPGAGAPARNVAPGTGTLAKNTAPGAGAPARNVAPGAGTLAKNTAPGAGAPARNVSPGTGTLAKNTAPGAGAPARNVAPGAGTLAKNTAPGAGAPAKNVAPGTGPPANRQYNQTVNNGASKGNPPPSK